MATKRLEFEAQCEDVIGLLAEGGDERIAIDPHSGLNRYLSAPRPASMLAFSSTTANDLSADALAHLAGLPLVPASPADYAARLEALRRRVRSAYELEPRTAVVFSPSGTDLEYIAIACSRRGRNSGVTNILLGADEVGSGCIHSANGRHFAARTSLGVATAPGAPVEGLSSVRIEDIAVRDECGRPRPSTEIADAIDTIVRTARAEGRHVLAHVVHGSKTGLVVPALADLDRLRTAWGDAITWVVDACQARINPAAVQAYLERGAIVLLTGSKFAGAPPFCGFALVPNALAARAEPLQPGLATIFLRAEWPAGWPGAEQLPSAANPGLLLRLEAALFEIERYRGLDQRRVCLVTQAFGEAVRRMVDRLGVALIPGDQATHFWSGPELDTLYALDLSNLVPDADFDDAMSWHRTLVNRGIRLGQPVRSAKLADGRWSPILRVALSMPMIVERVGDCAATADRFDRELGQVADALLACADRASPVDFAASAAA